MWSKKAKSKKATSNVFAMFDQPQIYEFKKVFNMTDQNREGSINKDNLQAMLTSLGKNPTDAYLNATMKDVLRPVNFTLLLMMFGEKLNGTDPEDVIRNVLLAFMKKQQAQLRNII